MASSNNHFRTTVVFILLVVISKFLEAQEFRIIKISTDEYPVISAKFVLTNKYNDKITDLTREEIKLQENYNDREIIYLKNPELTEMPLSILLVFDISGSMKENRINIAKEAARILIDEVDLANSEIAISTFNYNSFLNCDFTHDPERLKNAINTIEPDGGTSYNDAFLEGLTGGIEIARQGMFKKIIIFMTDGLGDAKADTIIKLAKKEDITIFTTTIELDMPPVLKKITRETGGYFFEQINDPESSKIIYKNLYRDIVATEYGIMKWMATEDCEDIHHLEFNVRGLTLNTNFELPVDSIEGLVVIPSSFYVRSQKKDTVATKYIRLASPHKSIAVTNIFSTDSNIIQVEKPVFPLELHPGKSHQLKVTFPLHGSSDGQYQLKIYTENCLQRNTVDIQYGVPGKIEVIRPAEGDIYGTGMDTVIEWRGVSKNQPISLYCRYEKTNWQKITETKGLKYSWKTPYDTSNLYQIMAKPADENDFSKKHEINSGRFRDINLQDISNDGSMIITRDAVGMVNVFQIGSKNPLKIYKNNSSKFIYFSKDDLSLINYGKYTLSVNSIFTNSQGIPTYWDQYKIFAAHPTLYGDEYLLPAEVSANSSSNSKIRDIISKQSLEVKHDKNAPLFAAYCVNAPYILWLNTDYSLDMHKLTTGKTKRITRKGQLVTKAYICPSGKYIYTEQSNWRGIIETNRGKPILNLDKNLYVRFSPDGNRLLTIDSLSTIYLWDLDGQQELLKFPHSRYFNFSYNGSMFYYVNNNMLTLFDINKRKVTHKIVFDNIGDISIAPDGSEVLITLNGQAEIYDCVLGSQKAVLVNQSSPVSKVVYAGNNRIITINKDKSITIWEPSLSPETGYSGRFSVVSPLPEVTPEYDIGVELVNQSKEVILEKFVTNYSPFPIQVLQFEWESFPNEFTLVSNPPPFKLLPGESKDIEIRFSPSDSVVFTASLAVITPGGNVSSNITGRGINKKFEIPDKIVDFGKIEWNTYKDTSVVLVKNISDKIIHVEKIEYTDPGTKQFQLFGKRGNVILQPGQPLKMNMRYTALYRGRASCGLKIKLNGQLIFIKLFGEGIGLRSTWVKGKTIDQDSVAIQTGVICKDLLTNRITYNNSGDSLGNFGFRLNAERSYIVFAEKEGYISGSENIDLTQPFFHDTIETTIMLSKIEQGSLFRLNGVFFEFAKAELIPSSKADLGRVLELLQKNKNLKLEVHGHTDAVGTDASNNILSKNRANAVRNYLIENDISPERIFIQFFGETRPVATNETEGGRQLNRRVEFLIKE